ncbi:hypothetical protein BHM03_00055868 [Ensete ventricosum]|nr:hypothetical protein BHM03_00055868 [Ensete ventricosum]
MLGLSQVRVSGRSSNDVVGTCQETRRKLAEGIGDFPGVRWELAEGDRELARKASRVHRKKTKRLIGRSSEVTEKLVGSYEGLVGLDSHNDCN